MTSGPYVAYLETQVEKHRQHGYDVERKLEHLERTCGTRIRQLQASLAEAQGTIDELRRVWLESQAGRRSRPSPGAGRDMTLRDMVDDIRQSLTPRDWTTFRRRLSLALHPDKCAEAARPVLQKLQSDFRLESVQTLTSRLLAELPLNSTECQALFQEIGQ